MRGLDGYSLQRSLKDSRDREGSNSDDSDLFLELAREEALAGPRGPGPIRRVREQCHSTCRHVSSISANFILFHSPK